MLFFCSEVNLSYAYLPTPKQGFFYHGVYPGGKTGEEDDITLEDLKSYESVAGKRAAWVYFSNNWYKDRAFPVETASWIRNIGSIPYIRLMLRSSMSLDIEETVFTLQNIIDGRFDRDLRNWCSEARRFRTPVIVEYGTEVNGAWFPWNGVWNGADTKKGYGDPHKVDGPERFRDAYRHIIQVCRDQNAYNITWVFHINAGDSPEEQWNAFENYYPGEQWIDWIGISAYGPQTPLDDYWNELRESLDGIYTRVKALADKPVFIAEFGVDKNNPLGEQEKWARNAFADIISQRWPSIMGFSWWNERWSNDTNPAHDTTMCLEDNLKLQEVFQELVKNNPNILEKFIFPSSVSTQAGFK